MRIRMLHRHVSGVDGGTKVMTFEAGQVYDVEQAIALSFIKYGHAIEDKMVEAAPETKAESMPQASDNLARFDGQGNAVPEAPVTKTHKAHKRGRR